MGLAEPGHRLTILTPARPDSAAGEVEDGVVVERSLAAHLSHAARERVEVDSPLAGTVDALEALNHELKLRRGRGARYA